MIAQSVEGTVGNQRWGSKPNGNNCGSPVKHVGLKFNTINTTSITNNSSNQAARSIDLVNRSGSRFQNQVSGQNVFVKRKGSDEGRFKNSTTHNRYASQQAQSIQPFLDQTIETTTLSQY